MGIYEDVELLQQQVAELQSNQNYNILTGVEVPTHEKVNNKTVYCKSVDIGTLPNSTNKLVPSGLNMNDITVVKIEGIARNSNGTTIPLPNATPTNNYVIGCFLSAGGNITIDTVMDRSDYTGIVRIFYTKNQE